MDSLLTDLAEDRTFLLIRLPKETVERCEKGTGGCVGSVYVYDGGYSEFQDNHSAKVYSLLNHSVSRQTNNNSSSSQNQSWTKRDATISQPVADDESDLFKISLQTDEAVHLGKVKPSTLLAVPKVDEKDVSAVFG